MPQPTDLAPFYVFGIYRPEVKRIITFFEPFAAPAPAGAGGAVRQSGHISRSDMALQEEAGPK
jgi:hypothetical protein